MAYIAQKKERGDFQRLTDMMKPEATPTKRTGTEAPVGSQQAGTKGGQTAEQFTKTQGSPGGAFKRQLAGADIGAITRVAEQPLLREAGEEARRVASEAAKYRREQEQARSGLAQYDVTKGGEFAGQLASGDEAATAKAKQILSQQAAEPTEFRTADIKEFTPMQALRGGTVEGLLRQEAKGPYSTGMAGLDALLFQKKGGVGQLAAKGQALRTTEQAIADILQGKGVGGVAGSIADTLKERGFGGGLAAEEKAKAEQLISSQREALGKELESATKAQREAYTKAEPGQKTKLQQKQAEIEARQQQTLKKANEEAAKFYNEAIKGKEQELGLQFMFNLFPESRGGFLWESLGKLEQIKPLLERDPNYQKAMASLRQTYGKERTPEQMGVSNIKLSGKYNQAGVPLSLQQVMSPEDMQKYNRLQSLLGKEQLTARPLEELTAKADIEGIRSGINRSAEIMGFFRPENIQATEDTKRALGLLPPLQAPQIPQPTFTRIGNVSIPSIPSTGAPVSTGRRIMGVSLPGAPVSQPQNEQERQIAELLSKTRGFPKIF